jgi:ankyrin repeat protein
MAWLAAPPASGPQARLEALGLRLDADSFQAAVARGDVEQVRLFLEAGLSAKTRMEDGMSLLSLALLGMPQKTESEEIVIALVRAGADVEERTPTGLTPLMRAAFSCKPRVVAALIEAGAKLDARSGTGDTALGEAGNCPEAAALLRKAGAR